MFLGTIKFCNEKHCFVSIPSGWKRDGFFDAKKLEILELHDPSGKKAYVSCVGRHSAGDSVFINKHYASKLGFSHDRQVAAKFVTTSPTPCTKADVCPSTPDDWEILESSSSLIEETLLDQLRIVWKGQEFPIWVNNSIHIWVVLEELSPSSQFSLLTTSTEIHVSPRPRGEPLSTSSQPLQSKSPPPSLISSMWSSFFPKEENFKSEETIAQPPPVAVEARKKAVNTPKLPPLKFELRLRTIPFCKTFSHSTEVWVDICSILRLGFFPWELPAEFRAKITKLKSPSEANPSKKDANNVDKEDKRPKTMIVKVKITNKADFPLGSGQVMVPKLLSETLSLETSSIVVIESVPEVSETPTELTLHPLSPAKYSEAIIKESFTSWLTNFSAENKSKFGFSPGARVTISCSNNLEQAEGADLLVLELQAQNTLTANKKSYYFSVSTDDLLSKTTNLVIGEVKSSKINLKPHTVQGLDLNQLGGISSQIETVTDSIRRLLNLSHLSHLHNPGHHLLLQGANGSGKTSLARAATRYFSRQPYYCYGFFIDCKILRGKKEESIAKTFEQISLELTHRSPSILVLDDVHILAGVPEVDPNHPDSVYYMRAAYIILKLVKSLRQRKVIIIMTSPSLHSLHPDLVHAVHLFHKIVDVNAATMNNRLEILEKLTRSMKHLKLKQNQDGLKPVAQQTEGYQAQDLSILLQKACLLAAQEPRTHPPNIVISLTHLTKAYQSYTPEHLKNLKPPSSSSHPLTWDDVGGLQQVKQTLKEVLIWPTKYPQLMSQCPLRLQSGVLIYGPPGSGKTLLISVLAQETGLNIITIKGPELLSKYIGASEQKVREVFEKAQRAQPCILFFDEFDALAPRRGHDSTGVTDRVVNQFLTQMDGVEGLQGVYIVAATSQPELIDPALLRPGRLDQCLYCGIPTQEERLSILQILSKKISLNDSVDLTEISRQTDGFTGADLQGLLYNAQVQAFHDVTSSTEESESEELSASVLFNRKLEDEEYVECTPEYVKEIKLKTDTWRDNMLEVLGELSLPSQNKNVSRQLPKSFSVSQSHLLHSLEITSPSVTLEARQYYHNMYLKFSRKDQPENNNTQSPVLPSPPQQLRAVSKRATLA